MNNYIRVGLSGSSKVGKTTLVAILTKGIQDDGNGGSRNHILNYTHELKKGGMTQSIVFEIIGFDGDGNQILSNHSIDNKAAYQADVSIRSVKRVYLIDLCGDIKFFKHTISAITKCQFNLMIIVIAADEGITRITVECLLLCELFKIPFIIVLTKCDLLQPNEKEKLISKIYNQISINFLNRKLVIPNIPKQCADEMFQKQQKQPNNFKGMICPLFEINSLNRNGVDPLLQFLFTYHNTDHLNKHLKSVDNPFYMQVFYSCSVKDIGEIPFGLITSGCVKIEQIIQIGHDENGNQQYCKVVSIENVRNKVEFAKVGELVCLILQPLQQQPIDFKLIKIIADPKTEIPSVKEFWANISVLPGPTTIELGYKPIMESFNISRAVELKQIIGGQEALRSGDCALVKLCFLEEGSEAMYENQPLILRSNASVIFGILVNVQSEMI